MTDNQNPKKKGKKEKIHGHGKFQDSMEEKWVNPTPEGQLKDFSIPMADAYQPVKVEASWDTYWEKQGFYRGDEKSDKKEKFVMVLPPPNVTGTLHLGHALTCSVEDCVTRWHRMLGHNTLWIPGFDHAGIATQVVVEKNIMKTMKKTRHDLGREKFLEEVWKWKERNGDTMANQLRRLGSSIDWSRALFTMDEQRGKSVIEAFNRMFDKGLIYRSNRLVNWSCALKTAISSVEVEYIDVEGSTKIKVPNHDDLVEFGVLISFAYKVKGSDEEIVVSTTRIETMLGDCAVAVHPDDERYKKFVGKELVHPFIPERKVIVITDPVLVDMKFGTGAVKITPAHDPNDFDCGVRHNLPQINVFDDDGYINDNGGQFKGMKRFVCRAQIIEELKKVGLYRGIEPNKMRLGFCQRSGDVVEPVVRPQWWVKTNEMAARAVDVVRSGEMEIIPPTFKDTWYQWLENPQDWCISRQLWWGHRIPAWLVQTPNTDPLDEKYWVVAHDEEEALKKAKKQFPSEKLTSASLSQDPDVLDTWFSSGLFPFSPLGWPDKTLDLEKFFPTELLETGHDILFFWVARMVMMSLTLTDKIPFKQVFLHAMVRDKTGDKMSKSKGNVIDPIDVINGCSLEHLHQTLRNSNLSGKELDAAIELQKQFFPTGISECGSDALRFALLSYTSQGRDINLDPLRIAGYRTFCNKLWNATKFALMHFEKLPAFSQPSVKDIKEMKLSFTDSWILSRLAYTIEATNKHLLAYDFASATSTAYDFWLKDFCDVYLEAIKPVVYSEDQDAIFKTLSVLYCCLETGLKLLHPMMPFVTEELFHRLPGMEKAGFPSIMIADYPTSATFASFRHEQLESDMHFIDELCHASRSVRSNLNLTKTRLPAFARCTTDEIFDIVSRYSTDIQTLAAVASIQPLKSDDPEPENCISTVVNANCVLLLEAKDLNFEGELTKLDKKRRMLRKQMLNLNKIMSGSTYAEKTPQNVKDKNDEKMKGYQDETANIDDSVNRFEGLMSVPQLKVYSKQKLNELSEEEKKLAASIEELKATIADSDDKKIKKKQSQLQSMEEDLADLKELVKETQIHFFQMIANKSIRK